MDQLVLENKYYHVSQSFTFDKLIYLLVVLWVYFRSIVPWTTFREHRISCWSACAPSRRTLVKSSTEIVSVIQHTASMPSCNCVNRSMGGHKSWVVEEDKERRAHAESGG